MLSLINPMLLFLDFSLAFHSFYLCANGQTILYICWLKIYSKLIWFLLHFFAVFAGQPCSFPGSPAHSSIVFSETSLQNGTIASYSCERGFELLGPARRVCDNGNWVPEGIPFCGKYKSNNFTYTHVNVNRFVLSVMTEWRNEWKMFAIDI